ncbi:MAG: TolC family protein, partial [Cyclobacteriaceae bacterium]
EIDVENPNLELEAIEPLSQSPGAIYDKAQTVLPEIESADKAVEGSEYGILAAKGDYYPSISIGGALSTNYSSLGENRTIFGDSITVLQPIGFLESDRNQVVLTEINTVARSTESGIGVFQQFEENFAQRAFISLNIPILNGFRTRNNVQRAHITRERAELQALQARQTIRQNIETAYTDVLAAAESYEASQEQVESLEEAFRATEKQYNVGSLNFVDYQLATNNLFRARSELLNARFEYIFKKKILEFYQGEPISLD